MPKSGESETIYERVAKLEDEVASLRAELDFLKHALRNAAAPIITLIGLQIAFLISGSVIIEEVFVRPGLGRLLIRSIFQRDYPVVQGITLLFAVIFVTTNLIIDIIRGILDPRVGETENLGK